MSNKYHEQQENAKILRIRTLLEELPPFLAEYFRGKSEVTSINTRLVYAYDLRTFFTFLVENCPKFKERTITTFLISDLNLVDSEDVESFVEYLTFYTTINKNGSVINRKNKEKGKGRKLAAVKTLFKYFYRKRKISNNCPELVDMPKVHQQNIVRLENHEVAKLLVEIETGLHLTASQKAFHVHTKHRDLALVMLLLGTGIRISECVGINIEDIDFVVDGIQITRKGGDQVVVYFGEEVKEVLQIYCEIRKTISAKEGHEHAFFLSLQNKRLTDRAIENLVKKYSRIVTVFKNISPHKLRSTFGTNLYRESRDIYLVADVLGHKDVNTTRKHYAQMDDERRKSAPSYVRLKEKQ